MAMAAAAAVRAVQELRALVAWAVAAVVRPLVVAVRLVPLVLINLGLIALAVYLTTRALRKMWHYDRLIAEYKRTHARLAQLLA